MEASSQKLPRDWLRQRRCLSRSSSERVPFPAGRCLSRFQGRCTKRIVQRVNLTDWRLRLHIRSGCATEEALTTQIFIDFWPVNAVSSA